MTIIYLVRLSPAASSDLPESRPGRSIALCLVLLRMGFTCAPPVTRRAVVSYTALPPLPGKPGGTFLLHCPWSRLHQTLSGILPCEARTFLTCIKQPRSSILLTPVRLYLFLPEKAIFFCQTYDFPISQRCQREHHHVIGIHIPGLCFPENTEQKAPDHSHCQQMLCDLTVFSDTEDKVKQTPQIDNCLLYTSPSPRDS